jgi:predicted AlkP superfamily phosphohydrolase/phosphomutase
MHRVMVIGLDGATYELIDPWINKGKLENLERLMNEGTRSILYSTPNPNSGPAWTSSITGVNPGKHGIFGFGVRDIKSGYRLKLANSTSIKAKTLPLILTEYGLESIMINVPVSYPPYKIRGLLISGMLTPIQANSFTYPRHLQKELFNFVPNYITEVSPFNFNLNRTEGKCLYKDALIESIRLRTRALKILMDKNDWDFFMAVFSELDRIQHNFWAEMDSKHPLHNQKDKSLNYAIFEVYKELDTAIGILTDNIPSNTDVIIISDHGFGSYEKIFHMNKFLEKSGFLRFRKQKSKLGKEFRYILRKIPYLKRILGLIKKEKDKKKDYMNIIDPRAEVKKIISWIPEDIIDWNNTKAFADQYGIRINLRGREPAGIIRPGKEEKELFLELKKELLNLKFPYTRKPVFTNVKHRREVYSGPFIELGPDLITFMDVGAPHPGFKTSEIFSDSTLATGSHKKEGILIAWGEGIKKGYIKDRANIMDVTPTICYRLQVPLTPEMDGTVLNIFEEDVDNDYLLKRKGTSFRKRIKKEVYRVEQELEIKKRLKNLGYID